MVVLGTRLVLSPLEYQRKSRWESFESKKASSQLQRSLFIYDAPYCMILSAWIPEALSHDCKERSLLKLRVVNSSC